MKKRGRKPGARVQPKAGLTPTEQRNVAAHIKDNAERWKHLFSLNAWRPSR